MDLLKYMLIHSLYPKKCNYVCFHNLNSVYCVLVKCEEVGIYYNETSMNQEI